MRASWASFAANGDPSTETLSWPAFGDDGLGMSLVSPLPQVDADFAARHHCSFWAGG
jgi:carboxylesterase type B